MNASQPRITRCALNRGMVRAPVARFADSRCGPVRSGVVQGCVREWCAAVPGAGSASEASHQLGQRRVRPVAAGQDRPAVGRAGTCGHGTPTAGSSHAKPSSSLPSNSLRDEVQQIQRFEGEEAVGDADRDRDALVGLELAGLHQGRRPSAVQQRARRRRARRTRAHGDDPVVDLPAVEVQPAEHAGAEVDRLAWTNGSGSRLRRHSSRKLPRSSAWRSTAPQATPGIVHPAIGRPGCHRPPRGAGSGRSRPSRRATGGAAPRREAASARGRPSAAVSSRAARSTSGRSTSTSSIARPTT